MSELQAIFGGTFDPVHYGHLRTVEALAALTGLQKVTLLPNNVPPHRPQPVASPRQRLEMLRCAIAGSLLFDIDDRELHRDAPSWTVTTLRSLRAERGPDQPLAFIIGQDSLLSLNKWHRWEELLSLSHLLVCRRPEYPEQPASEELRHWIDTHAAQESRQLRQQPCGLIFQAETPLWPVSATAIRHRLQQNLSCEGLLPPSVINYITRSGLYRD
ncbi:nicotinate-nucleotide adenylyltransferase [Tatumella sp. UCD-D_suzukii]|uniref:nicotinate-nucleotide adenylyltransferase n=1 Tax=Tatumella sp. UCD-D_suzukii TaxID=1408192 RepID=UPI0004702154|nr:nicotinate-nucleotide adenylyltransferase [Tatumella sp. UCD-D_suzukii]